MRKTQTIPSGQYDRRGIPICDGDLIRSKHYRHYLRKEQMWLYFIVGQFDGKVVVYNWKDRERKRHQCLLSAVGECEVIAEDGQHRSDCGEIITFNERPRRETA
jgi:hypothetical protein